MNRLNLHPLTVAQIVVCVAIVWGLIVCLPGCRLTDPSPKPPPEQTCWEQQGDTVRVCEVGDTSGIQPGPNP